MADSTRVEAWVALERVRGSAKLSVCLFNWDTMTPFSEAEVNSSHFAYKKFHHFLPALCMAGRMRPGCRRLGWWCSGIRPDYVRDYEILQWLTHDEYNKSCIQAVEVSSIVAKNTFKVSEIDWVVTSIVLCMNDFLTVIHSNNEPIIHRWRDIYHIDPEMQCWSLLEG